MKILVILGLIRKDLLERLFPFLRGMKEKVKAYDCNFSCFEKEIENLAYLSRVVSA
jgi:hypothetical protein